MWGDEMDETKFTKGEWRVIDLSHGLVVSCKGIDIADIGTWKSHEKESEANAHLIAAAPDLYAALEQFISECTLQYTDGRRTTAPAYDTVEKAAQALAKARGEP
jgi:hypothetical protein